MKQGGERININKTLNLQMVSKAKGLTSVALTESKMDETRTGSALL